MTNVALEGIRSTWSYTSFTIICMLSTFVLGWFLLQEFVSGLLQSRSKDELYGDIMHTGLIVCIFNISKFYLLLCFRKKLEIVDLLDSETEENTTEENDNETEDAYEEDRDHRRGERQDQVFRVDQRAHGLQREQGAIENRVNLNMDADQNQEEQNFPEIQDAPNLEDGLDGTNRQDNHQVQDQISQNQEDSEERVLVPDDIHMRESGNKNIQPRRSTRDRKMSGRYRSQSISEGQNYKSSTMQDEQSIEPRKSYRSSIHT